ncbi:Tn3 family transposase [Nonomuraea dietziae]
MELGKLDRFTYLACYFDDELLRRRVHTQLNRQESRHTLARKIFHGQKGELRQKYKEGQEDQLGTLGFITNVCILWNSTTAEFRAPTGYNLRALVACLRQEGDAGVGVGVCGRGEGEGQGGGEGDRRDGQDGESSWAAGHGCPAVAGATRLSGLWGAVKKRVTSRQRGRSPW